MPAPIPNLETIRTHFLAALPRIEAHARVVFRGLDAEARAEKTAEVVALAWRAYRRLCERGKHPDGFVSAVADYAARAVLSGRRLAGGEPNGDVTSRAAQARGGFGVRPLPEYDTDDGPDEALDALRDNTVTPPPEQAAFRLDWPVFLARMGPRDAAVVADMAAAETTTDLAARYGLTAGRISQIRAKAHAKWAEMGRAPECGR